MNPNEQYESYIRDASPEVRRRFDDYLLGYLLYAVDDLGRSIALEATWAAVSEEVGR